MELAHNLVTFDTSLIIIKCVDCLVNTIVICDVLKMCINIVV